MNTHIPQNIETMIELKQITAVPTQIIKPATSKPIIMVDQDSMVGAYLMTLPHVKIPKRKLFNLLMTNKKFNGILPESKDGFWRGQDLYSMFLPDVSITKGNNLFEESSVDDNKIIIKNGQFLQGTMDSSVLQKPLLHLIFNAYGPLEARDFLDNNQRTVLRWLEQNGFTLGYGDCAPTDEINENVAEKIKDKIKNVNTLLKEANMGIYKSNLDKKFIKFALENDIMAELESAKYEAHKFIRKHISTKNNMYVASKDVSGTKGSSSNIGQVMGTLGQQSIQGKRVPFCYSKRTLPFFARDDYSAESRGFVKGSFFNGMTPIETFFHQMGGRMGNIDTAIKTADSGYMQRRLIKALEDLFVKYGGTVRDGTNNIIQFSYGDDGIDPTKLEQQKMEIMRLNNEELEKYYKISEGDMKNLKSVMTKEAYQEVNKMDKKIFDEEFEMLKSFRNDARFKYFRNINVMDNTVFSAINFIGIIASAKDRFKIQMNMKTDLTPSYIREQIENVMENMKKYLPEISLNMFKILINSHLSYKKAILHHRLNKSVFTFIIDTIKERYMSSLVQAGEMVGIIAAQSIGEPLTQMSVPSDTKVIVKKGGEVEKIEIGELIDDLIEEKNGELFVDETKTHNILEINEEVEILSVSRDEKNSWKKISKVSRHPVNGGLMKVVTRSGKTTRATLSHSFLKRVEDGIEPVLGSELKVGQRIPVSKNIPVISEPKLKLMLEKEYELTKDFGYFCGLYLANGAISRGKLRLKIDDRIYQKLGIEMNYKNGHYYVENKEFVEKLTDKFVKKNGQKIVPGFVYGSNLEFIGGLISGYIESAGSIDKNKNFVRVSTVNQELINDICLLLGYVGIFGVLGYDKRSCKSFYLHLSKKYAKTYFEKVGFYLPENIECVENIIKYNERDDAHDVADYVDKIPSVGELIGDCGRLLGIQGHSRIYGRWKNKESIGRRTLEKYIEVFKSYGQHNEVTPKVEILEQATNSDVVWDEIVKIDYYDGGNEYVYDFTVPGTESFMVDTGILVHNTLNSVEWNTEILIKEDNVLSRKKIGKWIDERIANAREIEEHPNDTKLEYIKDKKIYVPACREDGKVIWDEVEAVTKHPVINKDGTNTLLKITTQYGREVIATKAKSFLKRVNNKIIGVDGEELKVGDYLPVSRNRWNDMVEELILLDDYTIPNVITKQWGNINILRNSLDKIIKKSKYEEDRRILENIKEEDIYYDKIINIEEIVSEHHYVYDLTVKETRNFNIYNGLCMRDTFHAAGQGASSIVTTQGIPRIKEIINVAKTIKTPAMFIYLKDEYNHDIEKAKQVLSQIEFTKLQDIVDKTMILYERKSAPSHYKEDVEFIQTYQEFAKIIGFNQCPEEDLSNWVLRIIFNKEKMMNKKIYLKDIQDVIMRNDKGDDVECVFSDDNAKELMMRIKVREDKVDGDYIDFLKELEKVLMSITIRGIPNVEKVEPAMLKKLDYSLDGTYKQNTEWFLGTIGVNLLDVLMNESVDASRTKSNDILEILEIFGIEAARNLLIEELLSQLANYEINFRHISLLGDLMTHKGNIMPIERHGINRSAERGPIAKATFEESTEILVKASTFSEVDKMGGVSANVMFGQFPRVGTNAFDVLFDEAKFLEEVAKRPKEEKVEKGDMMEDIEKELDELEDNSHLNDAFGFDLDVTKNSQTELTPHTFPEGGFQVKGNKKTIKIKKKMT